MIWKGVAIWLTPSVLLLLWLAVKVWHDERAYKREARERRDRLEREINAYLAGDGGRRV